MLLRVLYCSRTSLLLFYFARKGRRGGESERGISFRSPSRFVKGTKMDTAILENKPAFALCHDHQTLYIVCKKTANCSLKGDKMFYANGTDVAVKFNFFCFWVLTRGGYVSGHARMLPTKTNLVPRTFFLKFERSFHPRF